MECLTSIAKSGLTGGLAASIMQGRDKGCGLSYASLRVVIGSYGNTRFGDHRLAMHAMKV